jgi:SAM-dependent MidA family methyltransferase
MQAALYDPHEGYYCRHDRERWGRSGDYRTAPEISPLFGATFARYFAGLYEELGSPGSWSIIEAGAGSGEFARQVLHSLERQHARVFAATRYLISEISESTRTRLRQSLAEYAGSIEFIKLNDVQPIDCGVIFSNELLDAFPVYRIIARHGKFLELRVGLDETESFQWVESELIEPHLESWLASASLELPEGQVMDVNIAAAEWVAHAATVLSQGFIISVDYGAERGELISSPDRRQGTLRAFYRHQLVDDVFARPGQQDLTTTVDWTAIREAAAASRFLPASHDRLDQFLLKAGFLDELERESSGLDAPDAAKMRSNARDMIMPNGMAASFQVLVLHKL